MIDMKMLGTGCPKCPKLLESAKSAATELGIAYELEKVTELDKIMGYGVKMTPALVVNGQVKVADKAASIEEIKGMLQ